ncbi:DUF1707 domain-containing protein [Agromyces mediolanus]|uniref:DUF1707 SHOCT-like domain-containing protein n=1 Tax=Agromyces mediolanus TaxID=41986 RepID=UPI00383971B1
MNDYAHPDRPEERLSTAEREAAVDRLSAAQLAGRITPEEFGERSAAARRAVTRADLVPLFADLPPGEAPAYGERAYAQQPSAQQPYAQPSAGRADADEYGGGRGVRPLGGAVGATIMALVPFAALALFFLSGTYGSYTWSWIWFLLIPIAGIIIYGPGSTRRR